MSYLSKETITAAKSHDAAKALELLKVQQRFLKNHLGKWIGLLSGDISKHGSPCSTREWASSPPGSSKRT